MIVRKSDKQGVLIAIEGIDGAGKTTQAERLAVALTSAGHSVLRTKEPTDSKWGRQLRASAVSGRLNAADELELFLKDRQEHVRTVLKPAIDAGQIVIVDRYYFSTVAYQGVRGLDPQEILSRNEVFAPKPDLLVLLEVDAKVGLQRIRLRGDKANTFEQEANLRAAGRIFAQLDLPYLMRIDGALLPEDITSSVLDVLYDGPLASEPRPVHCEQGRAMINSELFGLIGSKG
ncbi:dTMP kinase [Corallococcus sicarius]|uniref:Thymidylate kinase n=2 Tax=Corallococcus sicarius TaxID=2316726 RepID=A0A3A8N398_9BACT|nr:dTMP kinase [Corallococcus sicarius]